MSKVQGLKKNVVKATIEGMEFVRVTNLDANGELINVIMYTKVNDRYKVVLPSELPHQVVNKLAIDNSYAKMTEEEIIAFLDALKSIKEDIKTQNDFLPLDYLVIDTVVDVNYILTKEGNSKYYALNSAKVNEFGIIQHNTSVTPLELPYVLIDIIDNGDDFKFNTFLVHQNVFAHVYREEDKHFVVLYEFKPAEENAPNPSVQVKGMFTLVKTNNEYSIVFDTESSLFVELNQEKFQLILDGFLDNIGLEKIAE